MALTPEEVSAIWRRVFESANEDLRRRIGPSDQITLSMIEDYVGGKMSEDEAGRIRDFICAYDSVFTAVAVVWRLKNDRHSRDQYQRLTEQRHYVCWQLHEGGAAPAAWMRPPMPEMLDHQHTYICTMCYWDLPATQEEATARAVRS